MFLGTAGEALVIGQDDPSVLVLALSVEQILEVLVEFCSLTAEFN